MQVLGVNWDHFPVERKHSIDLHPNEPWKKITHWASNGNIGGLIDELEHVQMLHRGCHPMDH